MVGSVATECVDVVLFIYMFFFFFQAEDGIRDAQESRGLGDVYKRQVLGFSSRGRDGCTDLRRETRRYIVPSPEQCPGDLSLIHI